MEDFLEEKEDSLKPAGRPVQEKDVCLVRRREDPVEWNAIVYIRKHLIDVQKQLDDFMNHAKQLRMYVEGSPGCGKTCFLYLWARLISVLGKNRVLIVQFRQWDTGFVWIQEAYYNLWRLNKLTKSKATGGYGR